MLIINGGIAMLNNLLLASYSVFCSCIMGGTCCGGVCQCGEGVCCNDVWQTGSGQCCDNVWHPTGENLCGEGNHLVYSSPSCCDCVEDGKTIADLCCVPGIPIHEKQDGECKRRCCDDAAPGNCTDEYPADCTNTSLEGSCYYDGCPGACCTENAEGTFMDCVNLDDPDCVSPAIKDMGHACGVDACHGMCCGFPDFEPDTDVYSAQGMMTLEDCLAMNADFQGVGITACLNCGGLTGLTSHRCRAPFDECCCEEKTTTGAGLVFTAPRNKQRYPPLDIGKSKQFTIELRTESDIRIHGELFSVYSQCLTTIICHDEINVEPVPCGSNFKNLWIKVCWTDQGYDREDLLFPECQGMTIWLGNCESATEADHCTTYTTYSGNGLTSDVDIVLYGDAHITADGTGPLVISEPITNQGTCARTLTIDGISPQLNSINGGITDVPGGEKLTVVKDGVGTWRFGASSSFEGQLQIKQGTIIAGVDSPLTGTGVFGSATDFALLAQVGDSGAGSIGIAAMLLADSASVERTILVAALGSGGTQVAILGGANTSGITRFSAQIRVGRDVTLQAATGGVVRFNNTWLNLTGTGSHEYSYQIGTAGNLGTVRVSTFLATTSGSVSINYGTLLIALSNSISYTTPVSIGISGGSGTLNFGGNALALSQLTFIGSGSFVTSTGIGALTMQDGASPATITVESGTGHQISSNMVLASNLTVHVPLGATLLISGNISGAFTLTRTGCGTLTLTGTNTSTIVNIPC